MDRIQEHPMRFLAITAILFAHLVHATQDKKELYGHERRDTEHHFTTLEASAMGIILGGLAALGLRTYTAGLFRSCCFEASTADRYVRSGTKQYRVYFAIYSYIHLCAGTSANPLAFISEVEKAMHELKTQGKTQDNIVISPFRTYMRFVALDINSQEHSQGLNLMEMRSKFGPWECGGGYGSRRFGFGLHRNDARPGNNDADPGANHESHGLSELPQDTEQPQEDARSILEGTASRFGEALRSSLNRIGGYAFLPNGGYESPDLESGQGPGNALPGNPNTHGATDETARPFNRGPPSSGRPFQFDRSTQGAHRRALQTETTAESHGDHTAIDARSWKEREPDGDAFNVLQRREASYKRNSTHVPHIERINAAILLRHFTGKKSANSSDLSRYLAFGDTAGEKLGKSTGLALAGPVITMTFSIQSQLCGEVTSGEKGNGERMTHFKFHSVNKDFCATTSASDVGAGIVGLLAKYGLNYSSICVVLTDGGKWRGILSVWVEGSAPIYCNEDGNRLDEKGNLLDSPK